MNKIELTYLVTDHNFNELEYLAANHDVAKAVLKGQLESGRSHYEAYGKQEKRKQRQSLPIEAKQTKLGKVKKLLRGNMLFHKTDQSYDFLAEDLCKQFDIIDTESVSSNGYDSHVLGLIEKHSQ